MAMNDFIKSVGDADFEAEVIHASRDTPVVVDVWAPWCGPCRALTPLLEGLAQEYQGKFILAKVNADENPEISQRYGVRSIPSVMAFVGGELIDQFLGAQPESAVRAFLDRIVPSEADLLAVNAMQLRAAGDAQAALSLLHQAAALEPRNEQVLGELLDTLIDLERNDEAGQAAATLRTLQPTTPRATKALARFELAGTGEDLPTLEARAQSDPSDLAVRLTLAKAYANGQNYERALSELLSILRIDRSFGDDAARKTMLALFELLGGDHPLVRKFRKELAATLH
jgi:putative thioredoxin